MRYRLDVVSSSVADAVRFAGGWLFDRVMAGWDVTVLVGDPLNDRPLQVLGTRTLDLETALRSMGARPQPQSLAVAADLFGSDPRVRDGVLDALDHGATEVTLWGATESAELDGSVDAVHHRLSGAARVFKAQALAAVAPGASVAPIETFRSAMMLRRSVAADLTPAS
ncbi:hypothetical protein ACAG26_24820 [Mycobacterium sp. pUA109]|uniref:hypothetical protein n=1 Tax=Mycobacterium sp. pUA109 TaxID=3238982 RepID=UPI00351B1AD6